MEMECHNCHNVWNYTGSRSHPKYTNCPDCMVKVQIPKATEA